jgi:NAD(P)-dependent dehydrogenase (short-subunit alcohol dehydrogenase family)
LEGWHDCLKQEIAHLGIKCIIFELGFFRTKMMDPENVKFRQNDIPDYDRVRNAVVQFVQGMNGNQPGDPRKAAEIILDIVREEGVAEGKALPARLPLSPDCLATLNKRAVDNLAICNDWEDVIQSTNLD